MVTVLSPKINSKEVTYSIPKTVPGTYSIDDYGKVKLLYKEKDGLKATDSSKTN
jgi:hypothetical protein